MRRPFLALALVLVVLCAAGGASAQVFTPTYLSPQVRNDIGVYLSDGPGNLAIEGIWRGGPIGIRLGYVDASDGLLSLGGAYFRAVQVEDESLELLATLGAQGLIGEGGGGGAQAGVSAGYTFLPGGIPVTPYLHPRVALVDALGEEGLAVEALAEVGAEVVVSPQWVARLSVGVSGVGANVGFGVAVRPPRAGVTAAR